MLRKACGVENTALQHLMLLFSLNAPDKVRSRKTGQAALSRYEKARSAKKVQSEAPRLTSSLPCFSAEALYPGMSNQGLFSTGAGFSEKLAAMKKSEKNQKKS